MELIEGVALSNLCDYSFGDQSGQWGNIYTSFMKEANLTNVEFVSKLFEVKKSRNYMTLFIDNIRLYKRHIIDVSESDRPYVDHLHSKNDLLRLCGNFPSMKFIIFTNLEDTPIDDYIFDVIPNNVVRICAVNAISHGGKVVAAPYGVQRKMTPSDNRNEILLQQPEETPHKLLHVSLKEDSHSERKGLKNLFVEKQWALVDNTRVDYSTFLKRMKECKFVLCPRGNAIDCHRNWETIYMRRVPVMKRYPYLEHLFEEYPVLFVDDYSQVTEELLIENNQLFLDAQTMDISKLDLNNFLKNAQNFSSI
jgi:hypothetical protein